MGTLTYSVVVTAANCTILYATSTHTVYSVTIIALSILSFFLLFWAENNFTFFKDIYQIFPQTMTTYAVYFLLFIASFGLWPIDKVIHWSIFDLTESIVNKEREALRMEKLKMRG